MNIITLPVSLGEALDKLTILDIKMNKIKDQRLENVKKEYNMLYENLKEYVEKYSFHYENLKKINLIIWEMQDDFRYNKGNKIELCLKIIDDNDARFRIKNKINILSNSLLKEQKGYKPKQCVFFGHYGLGDHINMIGAVRYLSLYYDEVYIICFLKDKKNIESFYKDDSSIKIISISTKILLDVYNFFKEISELPLIVDLLKNKHIFSYGFAKLDKNNIYIGKENTWNKKNLPIGYYNNISCPNNNITFNSSIFWDYFHISENIKSKTLYNELLKNKKYIFIHNTSTIKSAEYNINCILNKYSIDMYSVIIINPEINVYNKEDEFYEIAQKFVYLPIIDYIDTIINAEYIILSDSCFFCLSLHLPIKTNHCYVVSRMNWSHIHNDKYKSSNINYVKKFINVNINLSIKINNNININKKAIIFHNYGIGDFINMLPIVNYLSESYDMVLMVCLEKDRHNISKFLTFYEKLKIEYVKTKKTLNPIFNINSYKNFIKDSDVFVSSWQNIKKIKNNRLNIKSDIPFSFYEEMNIDPKIFWDYFKIPYTLKSKELYDILKNTKYVLLHNSCSEYKNINHVNNILNTLSISKDDTLVINIEENIYNKEHKFYEIAQRFVYLPIIDYVDTIINAEYIILSDSCFFCLSLHLPIKTKKCYVISRKNWAIPNGKNYDYLYDHKYGFNNKLQKFISLKL